MHLLLPPTNQQHNIRWLLLKREGVGVGVAGFHSKPVVKPVVYTL
ncbi:MAG: hypothetical protein ACI90V_006827, partial [Bacillariaceae sp.]